MPVISSFYGIVIMMFFFDNRRHNRPHIHAEYAEYEALVAIDNGDVLEGGLPIRQMRLVQAWVEIHYEELKSDWQLAVQGKQIAKIDPLR